jgi:hypothetical protein
MMDGKMLRTEDVIKYFEIEQKGYRCRARVVNGVFKEFKFSEKGEFSSTNCNSESLSGLKVLHDSLNKILVEIERNAQ